MLRTRVIPCLLLQEGGLVKTVKFKNSKYIGDPINAVKIFNDKEVDELIFLDIDASKNNQEPNFDLIRELASECFMPFAYGGGIRTLEQIRHILRLGVEKVIVNHAALKNLDFIHKASLRFGSSTIIVAIDIRKDFWGHYKVYDHTRQKTTAENPVEYSKRVQAAGAGEIFLNNVDGDGTYNGLDMDVIQAVNSIINIPLIACGGISGIPEIRNLISQADISGIAAGSVFVFQGPHRAVLISYPEYIEMSPGS